VSEARVVKLRFEMSMNILNVRENLTESGKSRNDLPPEASIPVGACPLGSIVCTEKLRRRPSHPPEFEKENRALSALVSALADSPRTILQTLADKVLEVLHADSAGLSLLTKDEKRFYWAAIAGAWSPRIGGGTPRGFGPCGDVLDRCTPMLFTHWERRYPYLGSAVPLAEEGLLVPFYVNGKAVGTIWAIAHDERRKFDPEDLRLLESMGRFASAAYQTVESIDNLKLEIAARQKAEAEVRELARGLEAKIRRLVEANVVGIVIWDLEGAITQANDAFLRVVQYDREDLASGRVGWKDLTPDEWRNQDERAIADLKTTGVFQPFEKEYFRKDGSRVPVLLGGALFEGSGNEGVAFVLDLSEQKRTEERLNATKAELVRVSSVTTMGELAASVAHEVKQPLAAVANSATAALNWLNSKQPNLQKARNSLKRIMQEDDRASDILTRIREMLQKAPMTKTPLSINDVVQDVVAVAKEQLRRHQVSLKIELAPDLPNVLGDRIQLQQVLLNLVINAIEAMAALRKGPRQLLIRSCSDLLEARRAVLVVVRDSGLGLSEKNVEQIFKAFFTTKSQGMGMGLSISRSIIEAHGGRLSAQKNKGPGATFQFALPSA